MSKMIFINLPVTDLDRSIHVMILKHEFSRRPH